MHLSKVTLASGLLLAGHSLAIDLDLNDTQSINDAAKTIAESIMSRYSGDGTNTTGLFGEPYYFWESGLAWDTLIHYWHQTGDDSYNDIIGEALRSQLGDSRDFAPADQAKTLGNDDQSTWALAAMTAAEYDFPSDALEGLNTTWEEISTRVFDTQAARWDEGSCNGGLRWQIFAFNAGYDYKNSRSNSNFYQLAARLARFTGNDTYTDWSERVFMWSIEAGLIADVNSTTPGAVFDGFSTSDNCSEVNNIQWTADIASYLAGEVYIWNHTQTAGNMGWIATVSALNATFANPEHGAVANGTLTEIACAPRGTCNTDQLAYRAIAGRSLAQALALTNDQQTYNYDRPVNVSNPANISGADRVPAWSMHERIDFLLRESAMGAAMQCSGGENGTTCGNAWGNSTWDGSEGLGQDLSALNIILAHIPISEMATVNSSAADAGSSSGGANGTAGDGGSVGDEGSEAAEGESSTGAAGRVAVSTVGMLTVLGSLMAFM